MLTTIRRNLWEIRKRYPLADGVWEVIRGKKFPIFLEFPIQPKPRYGHGDFPAHPQISDILAARDEVYRTHLESFLELADSFTDIPLHAVNGDGNRAMWGNGSFPALDAIALYSFVTKLNPATYLEVGYGNSTRFARRAIRDHRLRTRIVAIDPYTKPGVDEQCDEIIHDTMENLDLRLFTGLEPGDILFIDGSHWVFQNSDVVVFFLDVLPALPPGVWVHLHDITLPNDYGPDFTHRYWSEQYMLAAYLLGGMAGIEIQLPNHYLWRDTDMTSILDPLREGTPLGQVPMVGSSFWFRTVDRGADGGSRARAL